MKDTDYIQFFKIFLTIQETRRDYKETKEKPKKENRKQLCESLNRYTLMKEIWNKTHRFKKGKQCDKLCHKIALLNTYNDI